MSGGPFIRFDDMTWPNPDDPKAVEWELRYGQPTREQMLLAASFIAAYRQLCDDTQRVAVSKLSRIRQARKVPVPAPTSPEGGTT